MGITSAGMQSRDAGNESSPER
ncbi:hypothetical protein JRT75_004101 [Escherichia coli]|nr:hypothetical protein [Escherichia coli]